MLPPPHPGMFLFKRNGANRTVPEAAVVSPEKFTFFWRGPLSQWHMRDFVVDNITYNCAEQWMMASKARVFNDPVALDKIMKATNPKAQKALGRTVANFVVEVWDREAKPIVKAGSLAKFRQNPDLLEVLLAAHGTTLVEASPFDDIWGIKLAAEDPRAQSRSTWLGTNWLGEVLTEVCDELYLELKNSGPLR